MNDSVGEKPHIIAAQISGRLHQIFDDLVVVEKMGGMDEVAVEQRFLTRSYAALALLHYSDANQTDAAASITDGGKDDGIDAIYISEGSKRIYFVQSKWLGNTQKGISLPEFTRFRDGVKRVINLQWDEHNIDLHAHKGKVQNLLTDIDAEIVLVFAHNSEQGLSEDINRAAGEFLNEQNKYGEMVSFFEFTMKEARETARSRTRPENININVMLKNWGMIERPYKAVYGAVAGSEIASWFSANGDRLFAENLRYGIEKSEVNDGIRQTSREEPAHFWYYNNGVTAICEDVNKLPVGGNSTDSGVFDVKKISIINGAQTVSSLYRSQHEGANIDDVLVHLRVISLAGTPENFSIDVTTANNTQNDLSPVDFVAADSNQDRIRREAGQLGLVYSYRRGDSDPAAENGFTVREATIAAACASGELRLAVAAKRYISGLWENTKKEPYTKLFNSTTTADWLWKAVRIQRAVDKILDSMAKSLEGRERLIAIHANRFILFIVFSNMTQDQIDLFDDRSKVVKEIVDAHFAAIVELVEQKFPEAYPGNVFKNNERQVELLQAINEI